MIQPDKSNKADYSGNYLKILLKKLLNTLKKAKFYEKSWNP